MRGLAILCGAVVALAVGSSGSVAWGQFEAPENSLSFEDTGTIDAIEGQFVRIRDSKSEPWVLSLSDETAVVVEGTAQAECLRPTLYVEFTAEVDKKGSLTEPLAEITIIPAQSKTQVGLFAEDDEAGEKPIKSLSAGTYRVRGRLAIYKGGTLMVMAGKHKIAGKVDSDELEVKVKVDDLSLSQVGDEVTIKAWYFDAGRPFGGKAGEALAEELSVKLAKPVEHTGKKRQAERSTRPVSKSKLSK